VFRDVRRERREYWRASLCLSGVALPVFLLRGVVCDDTVSVSVFGAALPVIFWRSTGGQRAVNGA
jgi:hypothetical protein